MLKAFKPLMGKKPKVLILGTMPGRRSLALRQYYGHPQNQFWRLLEAALGEPLHDRPYKEKLAVLKRRGVAVWDVLASCKRPGTSLDSAICAETPADVEALVSRTGVKAVFFNGKSSFAFFKRHQGTIAGAEKILLPSSSPAYAGMPLAEKRKAWKGVGTFLALALLALPALGQAADFSRDELRGLVDKANKALRGDSSRGRLEMTIVTPKWKRTVEVEGWNRDRNYAFIKIHNPPKDRGTITLRRKNEMWLWMPKVERVIKIPPTMMHSSWQGSDFTYEDIVKADSIVKDYDHKLVSKKDAGTHIEYLIEALPKADAPVVWGKVMFWVGQKGEDVFPLKEEDYNERGELIRTLTLTDLKMLGGRLIPAKLECVPTRKPGQKTTLLYKELEFDIPLADDFFSLSRLQKAGER